MGLKLITPPSEEPVSVAEARAQCRIIGADEDSLLALYITAARQACEAKTGRKLVTQTWEQTFDLFPTGEIRLDLSPVQSITSINYVNAEGVTTALSAANYVLDAAAYPGSWVLPADGFEWPDTDDVANAVTVRFVCGYGAASAVPAPLKLWILATVASFYAARESIDPAGASASVPDRLYDSLLDEFRVYG